MKKLYLIGGIGASGKTTFSQILSKQLNNIPYYKCDDVYLFVKQKLNIPKDELKYYPMEETWNRTDKDISWGIYGTPEKLLETCYLEMFNHNFPNELILEGFGIFVNKRENKLLLDMFNEYEKKYFYIYPDYNRWIMNRDERIGKQGETIPPFLSKDDYEKTNEYYISLMPKGTIIITDIYKTRITGTGTLEYQNQETIDYKWRIFNFPDLKDKSFFEISCNTGGYLVKAKESGAKEITGLDISWELLDMVREKIPEANLICSEIEKYKWTKNYDYILCASSFHYYKEPERVIEQISKHTNYFLLETPILMENDKDISYYEFICNGEVCQYSLMSEKKITELLSRYFKSVRIIGETKIKDGNPRKVFVCEN